MPRFNSELRRDCILFVGENIITKPNCPLPKIPLPYLSSFCSSVVQHAQAALTCSGSMSNAEPSSASSRQTGVPVQKTLALVNTYVVHTTRLLNGFAIAAEDRLQCLRAR